MTRADKLFEDGVITIEEHDRLQELVLKRFVGTRRRRD
jgi:hypothetical protein